MLFVKFTRVHFQKIIENSSNIYWQINKIASSQGIEPPLTPNLFVCMFDLLLFLVLAEKERINANIFVPHNITIDIIKVLNV